jgi:MerR family transcriptional regulator, light-induced transcriptional regulator
VSRRPSSGSAGAADLSIGQLAEATGIAVSTLRMWEARHAFPTPARLASGHRRYRRADVALVERVLDDRDRGLSLAAAITRARELSADHPRSLFAVLRDRHPRIVPRRFPIAAMLALSRAIEDECLARADRPLLAAAFQTRRAYRRAEPRWRELTRTAALAFVLADFPARRAPRRGPLQVPIGLDAPIRREWAVLCLADGFVAALAGWERPGGGSGREFEALWTTEPTVVAAAMSTAAALAGSEVAQRVNELASRLPRVDTEAATVGLANRMVAYLSTSPEGH